MDNNFMINHLKSEIKLIKQLLTASKFNEMEFMSNQIKKVVFEMSIME